MKSRVRIVSAVVAASSALLLAAACGGRTDGSYSGALGQSPEAMCRVACEETNSCDGDPCSEDSYECDDYGNCAPRESSACVDECVDDCETQYRKTLEDYPSCADEMQAIFACITSGGCRDCVTQGDRYQECRDPSGGDDSVSVDAPQDRFGAFSRLLR